MSELDLNGQEISEELRAKIKECTSPEELLALAKEEDFDLTDEQLEGIAGGASWCCMTVVGDTRDDIDEERVSEEFMTGELRGDELD